MKTTCQITQGQMDGQCPALLPPTQAKFCTQCGKNLVHRFPEKPKGKSNTLMPILLYYFACVILLGLLSLSEATYQNTIWFSTAFSVLALLFAGVYWKDVLPFLSFKSLKVKPILEIFIISILASIVVDVLADKLNYWLIGETIQIRDSTKEGLTESTIYTWRTGFLSRKVWSWISTLS